MAKVTITASGQSTAGNPVTVAVTVNNTPSALGSITLPEGSYRICFVGTSSTGVKSSESCPSNLAITWPSIRGRLVAATPTGEYVPSGLWAVVEDVDSARVNADGTYFIPTLMALRDTTKVVIRGSNEVFPTLARVERQYYGNYVQVSSVKSWTIPTGMYTGQAVVLSLEKAYKETPPQPFGFFQRSQKVGEGGAYRYLVGSYSSFPVKVATYKFRSTFLLSTEDEARLWTRLAEMNQTMGFNLFVQSDSTSVNTGGGIRATFNPCGNGGVDDWSKGDYISASVCIGKATDGTFLALSPEYGGAAKHEFLHASGPISHTCQWASVMEQNCLRNISNDLTLEDVAYWHLMRLVRGMERKYNTRFSLAQMHQGERVFMLGLTEDKVIVYGVNGFEW